MDYFLNSSYTGGFAKDTQHEKLTEGVIGQKVSLVAETDNLDNETEIVFKLFEKEKLLVEKNTALKVVQDNKEVTEVTAKVKDGYAVVDIELKPKLKDKESDNWTKKLFDENVKKHKDIKASSLYISVAEKNGILENFKENDFKLTTNTCACGRCNDYQDVWKNPEINNQTIVNKNRFEKVLRYNSSHPKGYYHKGTDILTGPTYKELHSLLCGEVVYKKDSFITNKYASGSLGNVITVKSIDKTGNVIYIMYCHLDKVYVKEGEKVTHGQNIGLSGSTGNASDGDEPNGTKNKGIKKTFWHVHIEAATTYSYSATMKGQKRKDPELFMKTKFDEDGKAI